MEFLSPESQQESPETSEDRVKSSLRLQYEAQVRVIRNQIGDLEKVRSELGLSQRKMAQLLMVDPSAWTRWNREGETAPPHVWRSLQWYLTLREKIPGLTPAFFLYSDPKVLNEKTLLKLESERQARELSIQSLHQQILGLQKETQRLRKWAFWGLFLSTLMCFLLFFFAALPVRADEPEKPHRQKETLTAPVRRISPRFSILLHE